MGDEEVRASLEGQDGSTVGMRILRAGVTCIKIPLLVYTLF